ncbi:MAG: carboxylate-amine ligase, partial [Hyphomicrobiales bacterium]
WRHYSPFLVKENRWRAKRYGMASGLVDFGRGEIVPFKDLLEELLELVREDIEFFDCRKEVEHARGIVRDGTSADRQSERYAAFLENGASEEEALRAVVDGLIEETVRDL